MPISTDPYALVVDDHPVLLKAVCEIIEKAGFRFYEASTGQEAVELLDQHGEAVTLLFSDVEMPGDLNGFALARHVAARWPHIEIVIASGRVSPAVGDMPAKATFIPKPFTEQMVMSHLAEALPEGKKPAPLKIAV